MIHPSAICDSKSIGKGTNVWAFAHILEGAEIGKDCNICDFVFIENEVSIGDRTTIKSGVQLWDGDQHLPRGDECSPAHRWSGDDDPVHRSWQSVCT